MSRPTDIKKAKFVIFGPRKGQTWQPCLGPPAVRSWAACYCLPASNCCGDPLPDASQAWTDWCADSLTRILNFSIIVHLSKEKHFRATALLQALSAFNPQFLFYSSAAQLHCCSVHLQSTYRQSHSKWPIYTSDIVLLQSLKPLELEKGM